LPAANDRELATMGSLSVLIIYNFSAKITHTPGILTPRDIHQDRSGGRVVPMWKSTDVMVDYELTTLR